MCALPAERQWRFEEPAEAEESIDKRPRPELKLVPSPTEKLPIQLVLDQKFERMNQIMERWRKELVPAKPADLGEKGMSFDLLAFVNLREAVTSHPDLLTAEQQARYQETSAEIKKRFDRQTLARIGIREL